MSSKPPKPKPRPVDARGGKRRIPRSFKELTPSNHFNPRSFFREMVWGTLFKPRTGSTKIPAFPRLAPPEVALTWIGHASFLIQFAGLNAIVDPNFANWLFFLKRLKRPGLLLRDLPPIDLVMLSHAHFDHFHKPSLRRLSAARIAVMPWGCGSLARRLGFERVVELDWWESFAHDDWRVTLVPAQHWGARTLRDSHRGWGGFILENQGRCLYHAGDSAYFDGFAEIGRRFKPEVAILPIGAYYPDSFRHVHMGPDEAIRAFADLGAGWLVPMHYGTFKLSFEALDEPERWLRELAAAQGLTAKLRILEEGVPEKF